MLKDLKTEAVNYASKLWAYLIPITANLLIYRESGYNLKVRGSNSLSATNIKINGLAERVKLSHFIRVYPSLFHLRYRCYLYSFKQFKFLYEQNSMKMHHKYAYNK